MTRRQGASISQPISLGARRSCQGRRRAFHVEGREAWEGRKLFELPGALVLDAGGFGGLEYGGLPALRSGIIIGQRLILGIYVSTDKIASITYPPRTRDLFSVRVGRKPPRYHQMGVTMCRGLDAWFSCTLEGGSWPLMHMNGNP